MPTFTKILETTLTTNTSVVVLPSIPSTYKDLFVQVACNTTYTGYLDIYMWANNDTSGLYSTTRLSTDGGTPISNRSSSSGSGVIGAAAGTNLNTQNWNNLGIWVYNYANTSYFKAAKGLSTIEAGSSGTAQDLAWLYRSTNAISSLYFGLGAGQFVPNSVFSLYGIKNS
jgi:hypothetical protein